MNITVEESADCEASLPTHFTETTRNHSQASPCDVFYRVALRRAFGHKYMQVQSSTYSVYSREIEEIRGISKSSQHKEILQSIHSCATL